MKKILLVLIPMLLVAALMSCDFSGENSSSQASQGSSVSGSESGVNSSVSTISDANSSDGRKTVTLADIIVTLKGNDELKKKGFTADNNFTLSIDVTVAGSEEEVDSLLSSDITAYVDVSGATEAGNIEFVIDITAPEGIEFVSASETNATVTITKSQEVSVITPPDDDTAFMSNGLIVSGTRVMEPYGGKAASGESTAAKLNEFKQAVGATNVYVLPAPLASAFYAPEKYSSSINAHKVTFEAMRDSLNGVKYVDVLGALSTHTNESIYSRTDHHWQALGAYYATKEFASVAGVPFADISTFTKESFDGFLGSLAGKVDTNVIKNNPETFTWYVPTSSYTLHYYSRDKMTNEVVGNMFASSKSYSKFIFGDAYTTKIETGVGNGRKLLLFKDSYGNALAPFLVSSFDEIIIADFRYFSLNAKDFISDNGITDVCFQLSAFAVAGKSREYITRLINY